MHTLRCLVILLALAAAFPSAADSQEQPKKKDPAKPVPAALAELVKGSADEFLKRFDKDKNGLLSKDEFPDQLANVFGRADRNSDGQLDKQEVEELLKVLRKQLGQPQPPAPPNAAEVERIVANFLERLDTNKDGKVSRDEAMGPLAQNFNQLDTNGDGFLDKNELRPIAVKFAGNPKKPPPGGPRANTPDFDAFDKDADGRLTADEVKGAPFADRFTAMDTNKDGKVDRKEFEAHFRAEALKKEPPKKPDEKKKP